MAIRRVKANRCGKMEILLKGNLRMTNYSKEQCNIFNLDHIMGNFKMDYPMAKEE